MRRVVFGLVLLAACATAAAQQPPPPGLPTPRIQSVFPIGAKAGPPPKLVRFGLVIKSGYEVTITGTDLDEPEHLLFSHPGIKGEYIEPPEPPDAKKVDPKKAEPKKKERRRRGPANTPHKFRVTVAADVPPGTYDLRFVGKYGVSNPRAFVVGNLEEAEEKEPNNDVPQAQRVAIGTTINGLFANSTDVDYTVFAGKKGQRVLVSCVSSSIDGRATPLIEVFDSAGRKLAANRNYRDNDALADVTIPADGEYYVRLSPFAYQGGGPDYFYRLTISTDPWIDAVFPPAIEPGKPAQVTLYGRNLPGGQPAGFAFEGTPLEKLAVTITPPTDAAAASRLRFNGRIDPVTGLQDGFEYRLKGPKGFSNGLPVYFAREKVVLKKNANANSPAAAEAIAAPCEVAGFPNARGDADWYSFTAKKGEIFLIELNADRIGTEADFYFSVRDGKDPKRDLSGEQDDDPDSLHPFGFYTRTSDPPAYRFTAPEDGKYFVMVGSRDAAAVVGPRAAYRLRVGPAKPDFRVVAMP
ncbi:MAG TPA: PPC domain-containing protein, partial [Gemmata sp.]|nr:PPC domain-containing protein [Gemmata sp.]